MTPPLTLDVRCDLRQQSRALSQRSDPTFGWELRPELEPQPSEQRFLQTVPGVGYGLATGLTKTWPTEVAT